jgi:uncharacterized membrane protein YdbT with pleckstrin-like domain
VVISPKLLNQGEHILLSTRTHVKALFLPAIVLIVVAAVGGYLSSLPSGAHAGTWRWVIWVVAALLIIWYVVRPFLRWLTTAYTFTNRRLITRTGILTRTGHDIPLNRISDIEYEKSIIDRMFGCGTLVVSDASEEGRVRLNDIPHVEQAQLTVSNELFHHSQGTATRPSPDPADDGT